MAEQVCLIPNGENAKQQLHNEVPGIGALFATPGVEILAPMVRASTLALRLECLRYGAGIVFGEELVDRKVMNCIRVENTAFGTTDFVTPSGELCFSTCPEERKRVIFQLGTADSGFAVKAAHVVCRDISGIDINMGCPKSFSIKGGMGAALLDKPEVVADILKTLRREMPAECALSCKIRLLPTLDKTISFMQLVEQCGVVAVTVHLRTRPERPNAPAHWEDIAAIAGAVRVPVVANGDFFNRTQISGFWKHCDSVCGDGKHPSGVMIARGALWNPAIFSTHELPSFDDVVKRYIQTALSVNALPGLTKWFLQQMTKSPDPIIFRGIKGKDFMRELNSAVTMPHLCQLVDVPYDAANFPPMSHKREWYANTKNVVQGNECGLVEQQPQGAEGETPRGDIDIEHGADCNHEGSLKRMHEEKSNEERESDLGATKRSRTESSNVPE